MGFFCSSKFINGEDMIIRLVDKDDSFFQSPISVDFDFCVEFCVKDVFKVYMLVPNYRVYCIVPDVASNKYSLSDIEFNYLTSILRQHACMLYEMHFDSVHTTTLRKGHLMYELGFENSEHSNIKLYLPDDELCSYCHLYIVDSDVVNSTMNVYLTSNKGAFIGDNFKYSDIVMFVNAHWDEIVEKWKERFIGDIKFYI